MREIEEVLTLQSFTEKNIITEQESIIANDSKYCFVFFQYFSFLIFLLGDFELLSGATMVYLLVFVYLLYYKFIIKNSFGQKNYLFFLFCLVFFN